MALRAVWGLPLYVEAGSTKLLFDTGPDPQVLEDNARSLKLNLSALSAVVISHEHGDHIGGLPLIARLKPGLGVYAPSHTGPSFKSEIEKLGLRLLEVDEPKEPFPRNRYNRPTVWTPLRASSDDLCSTSWTDDLNRMLAPWNRQDH
ncbi:MAG: hypothetical protein DRJ43_00955 [Thermoprotei archaeon]|nr:MAG: hypothetical protein DRJ43_00955 [Thermoprotei archaeon]